MLVQSGRPVGVMQTHEWAPRVLIANSNLVGDWANWEEFRRLEALGLTMYGQMTAGSWIYIGTQGILQGTYETFAAVAAKKFGGTLAGTITLTAGLGGMGGAQPLAVTMNDGVAICIDCDPRAIERRIEHRYLDVRADSLDHALQLAVEARDARRPLSIGVLGNAAELLPAAARRWARRSTSSPTRPRAHDPLAYLPVGVDFDDMAAVRRREARRLHPARPRVDGPARRGDGRLPGRRAPRSSTTATRSAARPSSPATSGRSPSPASSPPTSGRCSARARARSAGRRCPATPSDIAQDRQGDPRPLPGERVAARWIKMAGERVHFQGLPARICWLGYGERDKAGERFNDMVADGDARRAARHRPRPPRLRLGRLPVPRDRGHARRLRRDRRLAAAERHGQRRLRRLLGLDPPRRRRRHGPLHPRRARSPSPTARSWPARRSAGC